MLELERKIQVLPIPTQQSSKRNLEIKLKRKNNRRKRWFILLWKVWPPKTSSMIKERLSCWPFNTRDIIVLVHAFTLGLTTISKQISYVPKIPIFVTASLNCMMAIRRKCFCPTANNSWLAILEVFFQSMQNDLIFLLEYEDKTMKEII